MASTMHRFVLLCPALPCCVVTIAERLAAHLHENLVRGVVVVRLLEPQHAQSDRDDLGTNYVSVSRLRGERGERVCGLVAIRARREVERRNEIMQRKIDVRARPMLLTCGGMPIKMVVLMRGNRAVVLPSRGYWSVCRSFGMIAPRRRRFEMSRSRHTRLRRVGNLGLGIRSSRR